MATRNRCFIGHQTTGDRLKGRTPVSSLVCVPPAAAPIVARVDATYPLAATREANAADGRSAMSISLQPEPAPASVSPSSPGCVIGQIRHPRGLPIFIFGDSSASANNPLDGAPAATLPIGGGYPEPISVSNAATPSPVETAAANPNSNPPRAIR